MDTLLSLCSARSATDTTIDAFVGELLNAMPPMEQNYKSANVILKALLNIRPLSMKWKARQLHIDHENIFCNVKILTDLRPVFDVDAADGPAGFVMAHILKLGYHHSGKHTNLFIAMDKVDIDNLIHNLQRAKEKATSLSATISSKSGIDILED